MQTFNDTPNNIIFTEYVLILFSFPLVYDTCTWKNVLLTFNNSAYIYSVLTLITEFTYFYGI